MNNPQSAVADILVSALATPEEVTSESQETEQPETESPIEHEDASNTSETLETQPETAEQDIETLNNLAEELDIPIEDMYALSLKMPNADNVSLGELKNFYLDNQEAQAKLQSERDTLQAEAERLKQTPPVPPELIQAQAQMLAVQQEANSPELEALRHTNPAEWSAKQTELRGRFEIAQQQLSSVSQVVEARRTEFKAAQQQQLFERLPELKDDKVRSETAERLNGFISNYGFTPADLNNVDDSRLMHLIIEASKLYEMKGKASEKRIDTAPKVLKPGQASNISAGKKASLKRLTEKARAGQTRDKVNAVNALLVNRE